MTKKCGDDAAFGSPSFNVSLILLAYFFQSLNSINLRLWEFSRAFNLRTFEVLRDGQLSKMWLSAMALCQSNDPIGCLPTRDPAVFPWFYHASEAMC